ncbi:MAG: hypothetical protein AAGG07_09370 [Planctomycetota bacterium]
MTGVPPEERGLAAGWLEAVASSEIASALEAVYALAHDQIEARGPSCWASGRCCSFDRHGHRLYVTGLEAAYTVRHLDQERRDELTAITLGLARADGGCPFQRDRLCSVHGIKPLGCRTYFCDRSAQDWQHLLTERSIERVRAIHDQHEIPYRYGEWRDMLERFIAPEQAAPASI